MNFLIIVVDDLGWNDVGFHGSEIKTPFIDSLVATGVQMNQFYVEPICTPTRAAILSGKYPFKYGMQKIVWPWNSHGLPEGIITLPQHLKKLNYKTYAVGKWNLGHNDKKYLPTNRGFDHHYGCYAGCQDYYDHSYYGVHDFFEDKRVIYPTGHSTDLFTNKACNYIDAHDNTSPFFMYFAFTAPHVPLKCDPFWKNQNSLKDQSRMDYAGLVTQMDYSIGKLVSHLKTKGLYDDTLIWFTSDNGGWIGQGGDNYPYKGGKIGLYEGGVKAVNFIHYSKYKPKICNQVSHAVDIMPTIISLAKGVSIETDGLDVSQYLTSNSTTSRDLILNYTASLNDFAGAARFDNWKLLYYKEAELYDLFIDPYERNNVAKDNVDLVKSLIDKLDLCRNSYIADPINNWTKPNGHPPDYIFPKYWGQFNETSQTIKILNIDKTKEEDIRDRSCMELLGYPSDFCQKVEI